VAWDHSQAVVQAIVDHAPKATWYFSDAFEVYASLWYHWGRYAVSDGKTDTYPVEGNNAELRHYLARLARSSRCFFHFVRMHCTALSVCLSITST
jgi:IS1 family transposase